VIVANQCQFLGLTAGTCSFVSTCCPPVKGRIARQGWPKATAVRRVASCVLGMSSSLGVKVPCAT
jgi:hypothetical protein